jgi:hypothetical protein
MAKPQGRRIPLYVPPEATDVLDAIGQIAARHRWSRNKTIVEILKRSVRPHTKRRPALTRS